jgi:hypothetical protein
MPELPPHYAFRLEDLRAWHLVEVSCMRCRPSYTRLSDIERSLRCLRCGARGQASIGIRLQGCN